jgi:hypothetical protein
LKQLMKKHRSWLSKRFVLSVKSRQRAMCSWESIPNSVWREVGSRSTCPQLLQHHQFSCLPPFRRQYTTRRKCSLRRCRYKCRFRCKSKCRCTSHNIIYSQSLSQQASPVSTVVPPSPRREGWNGI